MYLHFRIPLSSSMHINVILFCCIHTIFSLSHPPLHILLTKATYSSLFWAFAICLLTINSSWETAQTCKKQILIISLKISHLKVLQNIWWNSFSWLWVMVSRKKKNTALLLPFQYAWAFHTMSKKSHGDRSLWRLKCKPSAITFRKITLHSAP